MYNVYIYSVHFFPMFRANDFQCLYIHLHVIPSRRPFAGDSFGIENVVCTVYSCIVADGIYRYVYVSILYVPTLTRLILWSAGFRINYLNVFFFLFERVYDTKLV